MCCICVVSNKTKYAKALAAHPLLCYRFSMTSTSSKAGIKRQTNHFAFETNRLASIVFELNVDACFRPLFSKESF